MELKGKKKFTYRSRSSNQLSTTAIVREEDPDPNLVGGDDHDERGMDLGENQDGRRNAATW